MTKDEERLAKQLNDLWTSFVSTSVPSADGIPTWNSYTTSNDQAMLLNMNSTLLSGLKQRECDLWQSVYYQFPPYNPNPKNYNK